MSIRALMVSFVLSGCVTHLGYVPNDVYAGCFWPKNCAGPTKDDLLSPPSYPRVKNWALQVADGYDTRAVFDRQAIYGGAVIAAASTSALVGLSAFNTAGDVITALPIGATFLGGTMAIYNNEQKAVIYGSASQTIGDLLIRSDSRRLKDNYKNDAQEAVCLHAEVSAVMRRVKDHINLLLPQNVADRLKGVGADIAAKKKSAEKNREVAASKADALKKVQAQKDEGAKDLTKAQAAKVEADKQLEKAQHAKNQTRLKKAKDASHAADAALKKAQDTSNVAAREVEGAKKASNAATAEADKAEDKANKAEAENSVEKLSAEANDFSDLKELPDLELCKRANGTAAGPTPTAAQTP